MRAVIFDLWDTLALWPSEAFEQVKPKRVVLDPLAGGDPIKMGVGIGRFDVATLPPPRRGG